MEVDVGVGLGMPRRHFTHETGSPFKVVFYFCTFQGRLLKIIENESILYNKRERHELMY